jgi:hypothetical protein
VRPCKQGRSGKDHRHTVPLTWGFIAQKRRNGFQAQAQLARYKLQAHNVRIACRLDGHQRCTAEAGRRIRTGGIDITMSVKKLFAFTADRAGCQKYI